jgi:L-lactate permease
VCSVCTGSLLLGAAGLLRGYRASVHWGARDALTQFGAEPSNERVCFDRNRITDAAYRNEHAEAAVFTLNWVSATGTAILLAALATAVFLRVSVQQVLSIAFLTMRRMRAPLATIMLMLALGFVTRYGGTDATLGLAFTKTGVLYPFFAAMLGWLGVALTGSDTSSNVLFGSLQKITAQQLGFNPVLIGTANSTGGVMGKMIDAQSVVATASTGQVGQEGRILRFVFWHSLALAAIMGALSCSGLCVSVDGALVGCQLRLPALGGDCYLPVLMS